MRTSNKAKVITGIAAAIVMAVQSYRAAGAGSAAWGVLFPGLPEKITTAKASHNTLFYILKQTHEPLFRKDDGDNFTSRILLSWQRSVDSRTYSFCPNSELKFNDSAKFTKDYFLKYISSVTAVYTPEFSVNGAGPCFEVRFKKNAVNYLDFLTLYENAPTLTASPMVEDGLGPFKVTTLTKSLIVLVRKKPARGGYNKVHIYDYKGGKDERLLSREISDFNRVNSADVPHWVKEKYRGFDNIRLKSVVLVLNHPSVQVRRAIYNCVDIETFRKIYFPGLKEEYDIQNIFPLGVPGALPGKPNQSCHTGATGKVRVELANLRDDNRKELEKYAKELSSRSGIDVQVVNYVPTELTLLRSKKTWAYNLLVIAVDAVRPEQEAFISPFLRSKKPFVEYKLPALRAKYEEMVSTEDLDKKTGLATKIMGDMAKEYIALPLFQSTGRMYYPKNIKNLDAGRGFLEYPEVAEFRW